MATSTQHSTITLTGASGTKYNFTLYPWGTAFKPVCAVYAIFAQGRDGLYSILYIGETENCGERFDAHHKLSCFQRNGVTHIGLLIENSRPRRLAIESDLIDGYKPPCNG